MRNNKIRIAVQKGGRLHDDSIEMLQESGIKVANYKNKLKTDASNFPLEALFLRDDDIPKYVQDGVADIGVVGENVLIETGADVTVAKRLGFSKCRLSIAVPREMEFNELTELNGMKIATTYPVILQKFLDENNISAEIHVISGSVEVAPSIGLADAIFDIVSTGSTLTMNGLKEVAVACKSEALLIANKNLSADAQKLLDQMLFRLQAVQNGKNNKYVLLNAPNNKVKEICDVLPGMNSPTVLPLANGDWSSVHSVLKEDEVWEVIEKLRELGAEGILVVPIEKMFV